MKISTMCSCEVLLFNRLLSRTALCWILAAAAGIPLSTAFLPGPSLPRPHTQRVLSSSTELYWYPQSAAYDDDIFSVESDTEELEDRIVAMTADLIQCRLLHSSSETDGALESCLQFHPKTKWLGELVSGRFLDLACTVEGEMALESLFWQNEEQISTLWKTVIDVSKACDVTEEEVVLGAVMVLQSLCVMGTQLGVMGPPEQLRRMVAHLKVSSQDSNSGSSTTSTSKSKDWDNDCVRKLKFELDRDPALHLLAHLKRKKQPQGAFKLLRDLGAWDVHEDLALLRSGFPIRFTADEMNAVDHALQTSMEIDPDEALGLRQDLRHLKVYTIDSASTSEIDDGVSIEVVPKDDGEAHRIWIHIADADRWASRESKLFEIARRRITSLYLPTELHENGSINLDSLVVTPSVIRVSYRLTYDDVDEMLEEGIGYSEEWELGALLDAAVKRRAYRIGNGSAEGMVPNPVPFATVSVDQKEGEKDDVGISVSIQVSHNAAKNKTATAEVSTEDPGLSVLADPVSSAYLLVTEAMILSGEAMGRWQKVLESRESGSDSKFENCLRLPFRTQRSPDFKSRARERRVLTDMLENNIGSGLCHAWYYRRFLDPVRITEMMLPHAGLGLGCYVQWSSPIRRFSDLQVHGSVKRYLRRRKVYELIEKGKNIPKNITADALGIPSNLFDVKEGKLAKDCVSTHDIDQDLNYLEGVGLFGASKKLQRQSQQYWIIEYVRRAHERNPDIKFSCVVLGCVDPQKQQYAIYVKELGLEHRYTSPDRLTTGDGLLLMIDKALPRSSLLTFVRAI